MTAWFVLFCSHQYSLPAQDTQNNVIVYANVCVCVSSADYDNVVFYPVYSVSPIYLLLIIIVLGHTKQNDPYYQYTNTENETVKLYFQILWLEITLL